MTVLFALLLSMFWNRYKSSDECIVGQYYSTSYGLNDVEAVNGKICSLPFSNGLVLV